MCGVCGIVVTDSVARCVGAGARTVFGSAASVECVSGWWCVLTAPCMSAALGPVTALVTRRIYRTTLKLGVAPGCTHCAGSYMHVSMYQRCVRPVKASLRVLIRMQVDTRLPACVRACLRD
jgi:hypothetical protein